MTFIVQSGFLEMKKLLFLAPLILAFGCATQLTSEGSSVRLVNDDAECDFVGTVAGSNALGASTSHDAEGAMNDLRNKAAAMGANAVKIIDVDSDANATTAIAEALDCDFN